MIDDFAVPGHTGYGLDSYGPAVMRQIVNQCRSTSMYSRASRHSIRLA